MPKLNTINSKELELIRLKLFKIEGLLLLNYRIGVQPCVESSKDFAEKLQLHRQQWQNIKAKRNHVQLETVIHCCKIFNVRPDYLMLEPIENEPFAAVNKNTKTVKKE